jgi:hypothetical protein
MQRSPAEPLGRFVLIVRSAPQLDVLDGRSPTIRERHDVMELEKAPLRASPGRAHERALAAISAPHRAPDVGRNTPRSAHRSTVRARP